MSTVPNHWHELQPFVMDEALLSIRSSVRSQLVKNIMAFEPHGIVGSNFAYFYILTLSRLWYAKRRQCLAVHQSGRSWSVNENALNS